MPPGLEIWRNPLFILLVIWTLAWKGFALWRAARNYHRWWFGVLLVVNTLAILEIVYLFVFGRRKPASQPG